MRAFLFSALAGFLLLQTACNKCPKDENLGDIRLTTEARAQLPYSGGEKLIFREENGAEMTFEIAGNAWDDDRELVVDVPCSKGSFLMPDNQNVLYDAENYSIYTASSDDQTYTLIYNIQIFPVEDLPGNDTLLVDYLEATAQFNTHVANHYRVLSERGNPDVPDSIEELNNSLYIGDFELLGKSFSNVYRNLSNTVDSSFVYVNQEMGIVGATTPEEKWVLDRVE